MKRFYILHSCHKSRLSKSRSSSSSNLCFFISTVTAVVFSYSDFCSNNPIICASVTLPWNVPLWAFWMIIFSRVSAFSGFTALMLFTKAKSQMKYQLTSLECLSRQDLVHHRWHLFFHHSKDKSENTEVPYAFCSAIWACFWISYSIFCYYCC